MSDVENIPISDFCRWANFTPTSILKRIKAGDVPGAWRLPDGSWRVHMPTFKKSIGLEHQPETTPADAKRERQRRRELDEAGLEVPRA